MLVPDAMMRRIDEVAGEVRTLEKLRDAAWQDAHDRWPSLTEPGQRNRAYHLYLQAWEEHLKRRRLYNELLNQALVITFTREKDNG